MNTPQSFSPGLPPSDEVMLAALHETEQRYFAMAAPPPSLEQLAGWRPRNSLWSRLKPLQAARAGLEIRHYPADGHSLSYWQGGKEDGHAVLLLHGFGASKENWALLAPALRRNYQLLVPDLPGYGDSGFNPDADYSCEVQADRIADWLRAVGIERVHVVGSSMGGAIAAQLAARHAQLVRSLCLMNAAGVPGTRTSQLEMGLEAGFNYLVPATRRDTLRLFRILMHRRRRWLGWLLGSLLSREMSHRQPLNQHLFAFLVRSLLPTYQALAAIKAPTLLLWGDDDRILDVSCVDGFQARIPHALSRVLPRVGHLPMLETPHATAAILQDFWRGAGDSRGMEMEQ